MQGSRSARARVSLKLRIIQVTADHMADAVSQFRFQGQTEIAFLPAAAQYQQFYLVFVLGTGSNSCASE